MIKANLGKHRQLRQLRHDTGRIPNTKETSRGSKKRIEIYAY
jgi:hypothetical protein